MIRRIALTFVFFAGLSGSYAMAGDKAEEVSPVMQCLVGCMNGGSTLTACVDVCVP